MIVLFPCNPLNNKEVDDDFLEEYNSAKTVGCEVMLYDHDLLVKTDLKFIKLEKLDIRQVILFRGYMLKEGQYHFLYNHLLDYNYKLINMPSQYLACHYFTNSYKLIEEFSNKIWFSENIDDEWIKQICDLNIDLIIKDWVKTEKGTDLFLIKSPITPDELIDKINRFKELRGQLFNIGIQFKKHEKLKHYGKGNYINEWRLFILNGNLISMSQNSDMSIDMSKPNLPELKTIIDRLSKTSNFFTIDVLEKENGEFIVIETGDGSVSGLSPNQNALSFWSKIKEVSS